MAIGAALHDAGKITYPEVMNGPAPSTRRPASVYF